MIYNKNYSIQDIIEDLRKGKSVEVMIDDWLYHFVETVGEKIYFFGRKGNTYQEGRIDYESFEALLKKYPWKRVF